MKLHSLTATEFAKAIGVGVVASVLLSIIAIAGQKTGFSPMPKPLGLAFAQLILGEVGLPVGLLFHVVYVTFWTVIYVALFRNTLTFFNALGLGLVLWGAVLVVFFPLFGWGLFGLEVGPKLIVASLVPHILFAIFIWGLARLSFSVRSELSHARH